MTLTLNFPFQLTATPQTLAPKPRVGSKIASHTVKSLVLAVESGYNPADARRLPVWLAQFPAWACLELPWNSVYLDATEQLKSDMGNSTGIG